MERGQVIVVAVVVAALALVGLKVWSDQTAESELDSASQAAAERLARAGGLRGDADGRGGSESGEGGARAGRPGSPLRPGLGPAGMRGAGSGADGRSEVARAGGARGGGSVGYSASGRAGGPAGDARYGGADQGGRVAPKVQQKDSLVEFLGSQPATQSDLASPENADGDDVALKIDKPQDIDEQGGQSENVEEGEDGDGIKITDGSNVEFPNNVNPDAATFSFNIEPDWNGGDQTDNSLLQLRGPNEWSNRLELVKNGEFLRFILTDNTGKEADISVRITDWEAGQRHDVRATYGDGRTRLYIDDQLVGSNRYEGAFEPPSGINLQVGGDYPGSSYGRANSTFRNLTITNSAHDG